MIPDATPPDQPHRTRPFYWSVRRELWENRAIHLAPLIAAGVVLLGVTIGDVHPLAIEAGGRTAGAHMSLVMAGRALYGFAAFIIYVTAAIVGIFYCLGALHGERRDRSILFWKSLPVSDTTTVLAKATVPLVILPLVAFVVISATQCLVLANAALASAVHGDGALDIQAHVPVLRLMGIQVYQLAVIIPWYAPLWAWLLVVSAWAKRMTFLWGVGPPLAACVIERLVFGTSRLWSILAGRLAAPDTQAFDYRPRGLAIDLFPAMNPLKYLSTPDLWVGLAVAVAFLAAAVWLRRRQEPI